jgi:hypothetical protein
VITTCYHCLFHNTTTIEEGDNIVVVTFLTTKPLKKATTITITFFCSKAIVEGDDSNCHCLLHCNNTIEENDDTLPLSSSFQTQKKNKTKHTKKSKTKKKKQREGRELTFKLPLLPFRFKDISALLLLAATFALSLLAPSSTLLLLAPTSALPLLPSHFKLSVLY